METISLNGAWEIKDFIGEDWILQNAVTPDSKDARRWRKAAVPGSIHDDLFHNTDSFGDPVIPNPYFELNTLALEWIPERNWVYRKTFFVDESLKRRQVKLYFKGVDYEGLFFLNGQPLGRHSGMFTPAVFDVGGNLIYGGENTVAVVLLKAPDEQPQIGRTRYVKTNKSRMNYWWDFCPRMIHMGIWDDVFLEVSDGVEITDFFADSDVDGSHADVKIKLTVKSDRDADAKIEAAIRLHGVEIEVKTLSCLLKTGENVFEMPFMLNSPKLWNPNGYGAQPLYEAEAMIIIDKTGVTIKTVTFGIRNVAFIKNETADPTADAYTCVVNGERIFLKGWNWVPADVLYGAAKAGKIERLLGLAKRANVNILRVWGGGLIEKDFFYDLCDRYGIMIWQEFTQSSSGIENKPSEEKDFIAMMAGDAEVIVKRKRNHPSLTIWCGGNELYGPDGVPLTGSEPVLAALKAVVRELDPKRYFRPTSAYGRVSYNSLEEIAKDPAGLHDVHGPWEHQGLRGQCELYNAGTALLSTEFGVEGMTNRQALDATIAKVHQWPPDKDNDYYFHRGAWWINYELVQKVFGGRITDIETMIQASQFLQAEGLRYAVESNIRRQFTCSGVFPWQFNEPYPNAYCTCSVDYYGQPKPVYYAVARAYRDLLVSAGFKSQVWEQCETFEAEIWLSNTDLYDGRIHSFCVELADINGRRYGCQVFQARVISGKIFDFSFDLGAIDSPVFFLNITQNEKSACRYIFTKNGDFSALLCLPQADVCFKLNGDALTIVNTGSVTAAGLKLEDGRAPEEAGYTYFSDNYFYLFPGESIEIKVNFENIACGGRRIEASAFNFERRAITEAKSEDGKATG